MRTNNHERNGATPIPLTSSQLALLRPDGTTPRNYDNVVAARFAPHIRVSPAGFRRALDDAVRAQAGYRLRFSAMTAHFAVPARSAPVDFVAVDDTGDILASLDGYPFDLGRGPLVGCSYAVDRGLVRAFAVSVPHIVLDGTTQELLLVSLANALTGRDVPTCDEAQYRQHIAAALAAEERALAEHRDRWDDVVRRWLADRVHCGLPSHAAAADQHRPERAVHRLPAGLADAVMTTARRYGVSGLDLVLAAYGAWLTGLTGASRHPIRLIVSVRERSAPPFAGCLVNTVPLVLDTPAGSADLVAATADRKRRALSRRFVPYVDTCERLLRHDEQAVELLERSTMVTYRRIRALTGADGERLADIDHTLPPAWPRAPILLRVLADRSGTIVDVETDHRLPAALHAGRIADGLSGQLADLSNTTTRGYE